MSTEAQESPREKIDRWLKERDRPYLKDFPAWDGFQWQANIVRAALAAFDEDHPNLDEQTCGCPGPWPCPTKARHEAALWKAIGGRE